MPEERPIPLHAAIDGIDDDTALVELARCIEELTADFAGHPGQRMLSALAVAVRQNRIRLPAMPEAIMRLERLTSSPDCRIPELAAVIEGDPSLAARLVGISNSAFYAHLGTVRSVHDAIVRLGLREAGHVVMAFALRGRVFRVPGFERRVNQLWRHTLAVAYAARCAAELARLDPEAAFFLGLVHSLGRVALLALIGDWQRAQRRVSAPDGTVIDALCGGLHTRMGALIASTWALDPVLVGAIRAQQAPASAPEASQPLAHVLALADELACTIRPGSRGADPQRASASALALGIDPARLEELTREAAAELDQRLPR